jgi:hypothetical protein
MKLQVTDKDGQRYELDIDKWTSISIDGKNFSHDIYVQEVSDDELLLKLSNQRGSRYKIEPIYHDKLIITGEK